MFLLVALYNDRYVHYVKTFYTERSLETTNKTVKTILKQFTDSTGVKQQCTFRYPIFFRKMYFCFFSLSTFFWLPRILLLRSSVERRHRYQKIQLFRTFWRMTPRWNFYFQLLSKILATSTARSLSATESVPFLQYSKSHRGEGMQHRKTRRNLLRGRVI